MRIPTPQNATYLKMRLLKHLYSSRCLFFLLELTPQSTHEASNSTNSICPPFPALQRHPTSRLYSDLPILTLCKRSRDVSEDRAKATEVHISTWLNSSLSDVKVLINKALHPEKMEEIVSMYRCHKVDGKETLTNMGNVSVLSPPPTPGSSTSQWHSPTLSSSSFNHGDEIFIVMG